MYVKEQYSIMFTNYPNIINIEQMRKMLGGISLTLACRLIKENKIKAIKIGRQYKIPKTNMNKDGYVCVNTDCSILKPDYVSHKFNPILKNNNLRPIRFHDLRHSCASLLLSNKVSMKNIQIWLGHSSYNTTANIYTHVDTESKQNSAIVIGNALNFPETTQDIQEDDEEEMEL